MQQVEDSPPERTRALSPLIAFIVLLAIVAIVVGLIVATRPEPTPDTTRPDPAAGAGALTDEEAIARFKELDALRVKALRQQDETLVDQVFVPGSNAARRISASIRRLQKADVLFQSIYTTKRLTVQQNDDDGIVLRQTLTIKPRFEDTSGNDVTVSSSTQNQVREIELALVNGTWLISKATIVGES